MKILVTGLCLSRNLGGPAMGLTLVDQLNKKYRNTQFTFAIEPHEYDEEKKWADIYGVNIVRREKLVSYVVTILRLREIANFFKLNFTMHPNTILFLEVRKEFFNAIKTSDLVIDMSGIAYVGDGVRGSLEGLRQYSNFYFAHKFRKPFIRFIQSFGPFDDIKVRFFAKRELNKLDFIPARGKQSASYCKSIVKDPSKVYSFPDSAIMLPEADEEWSVHYLKKINFTAKSYIVISPSAVINSMSKKIGGSVGSEHTESMILITEEMLNRGKRVLLLPHMYSPTKEHCDREIARMIYNRLKNNQNHSKLFLVEEDLNPMQAKALISNSEFALVARYHALVAAVSTGVPVITLGWNIKYKDLLDYYDMGKMAIDVRNYNKYELLDAIDVRLTEMLKDFDFEHKQEQNILLVEQAFSLLYDWIDKNYHGKI